MDLIEGILSRRSYRKYKKDAIPKDMIEKMLRSAMHAPSAGNKQPWHFIVIEERNTLNAISELHPYSEMLKEAPLAILICAQVKADAYCDFWVQDCSAATQNLLLAAHGLGLGSVWLGIYPLQERVSKIKDFFTLPSDIFPLSLVAIGYSNEEKAEVDRFIPEKIHYEKW